MIQGFYEEHLHADEEIRYIVDGAGYEDVISHAPTSLRLRFVTRMSDGFVALYPRAIFSFFLLVYIIVSPPQKTILSMRSGCLKIFPSGLHSIGKMAVLFRSELTISNGLGWSKVCSNG